MLVLAGAVPVAASSQQRASAPASLVFDGVTVVDVEQGRLVPDQRVVIAGNRIQAVGAVSAVQTPEAAQIVDARGKYLIPGLWDLHSHWDANGDPIAPVPFIYQLALAQGLTGIRDAGNNTVPIDTLRQWRREILVGTRVGPPRQLFASYHLSDGNPVESPADAPRLVDSLKAAGADMLKMYDLSEESYFAIAAAARRAGIPFGGHLYVSPIAAADSGATIVDHVGEENVGALNSLCFDSVAATVERCRPVAERWQRTNTWSVPTLIVAAEGAYGLKAGPPETVPWRLGKAVAEFWAGSPYNPAWLHNHVPLPPLSLVPPRSFYWLGIARQVGLPMTTGGDTRCEEAGFKLHAELALLVERGLTPLEALQAATLNPAKLFRATDSLGTVAAGKLADLVLLDADPLADITNTTTIRAVVANGRYFDRAALDRLLTEVRTHARRKP